MWDKSISQVNIGAAAKDSIPAVVSHLEQSPVMPMAGISDDDIFGEAKSSTSRLADTDKKTAAPTFPQQGISARLGKAW